MKARIGIRWTVGDVSLEGFEALRLSIWGAWHLFKDEADYLVCTNQIAPKDARVLAGAIPSGIRFENASIPGFLTAFLDPGMAEGVAWKFAPLRAFPNHFELALDNDCILWKLPKAIRHWLEDGDGAQRCLLAEDVMPAFGQFDNLCGPEPRNSGIRGFPPGWDFENALRRVLRKHPVTLKSELDEQGLLTAAFSNGQMPWVVRIEEVSLCSPFPPHWQALGNCGAHFCGLNAKELPWSHQGKPGIEWIRQNWRRLRYDIYRRVRAPRPKEDFPWLEPEAAVSVGGL